MPHSSLFRPEGTQEVHPSDQPQLEPCHNPYFPTTVASGNWPCPAATGAAEHPCTSPSASAPASPAPQHPHTCGRLRAPCPQPVLPGTTGAGFAQLRLRAGNYSVVSTHFFSSAGFLIKGLGKGPAEGKHHVPCAWDNQHHTTEFRSRDPVPPRGLWLSPSTEPA